MITPGVGKGMKAFRQYARGRAAVRHANGSVAKDAFHHLVEIIDLTLEMRAKIISLNRSMRTGSRLCSLVSLRSPQTVH